VAGAELKRMAVIEEQTGPAPAGVAGAATLDGLFRRSAARRPHAIALIDPPNRASFTDGAPRTLSYAEADRIVSALAARLRELIDRDGTIVGLQIANTVESVLAFMAVLRAGLIAMPLPLLWRRAEMVDALRRSGAGALIVSGRIGSTDHFELAAGAAFEVFSVRQVCGFGPKAPDGTVALDALCSGAAVLPSPGVEGPRAAPAPGSAAVVTWDVCANGSRPVRRSHAELIAGGLAVLLEGAIPPDPVILSTLAASSFGGLATTLLPWLLTGGTLALHHPFDADVFAAQCRDTHWEVLVAPGPLVSALLAPRLPARQNRRVIALWRAPEQAQHAADWGGPPGALIDVQAFGEIGLICGRRGPEGVPAPIPMGPVATPRARDGGRVFIEVARSAGGTLALRGPMVPSAPELAPADRFVDTGFPCRIGADAFTLELGGPPAGVVGFGGYRFAMCELSALISRFDPAGILVALPDALAGHRLAGSAADCEAIRLALGSIEANPLVVAAFRGQMSDVGDQTSGGHGRP
jgi:hypothetical protein